MKKSIRQSLILELIQKQEIGTQEELASILNARGCEVTQSTVSRDIRELNLTKSPGSNGFQKYVPAIQDDAVLNEKYSRVLKDAFISVAVSQNLLVVKTVAGMAMAVAAAIDSMDIPGVLGCIAGDDTIFCAVKSSADAYDVMKKLNKIARH